LIESVFLERSNGDLVLGSIETKMIRSVSSGGLAEILDEMRMNWNRGALLLLVLIVRTNFEGNLRQRRFDRPFHIDHRHLVLLGKEEEETRGRVSNRKRMTTMTRIRQRESGRTKTKNITETHLFLGMSAVLIQRNDLRLNIFSFHRHGHFEGFPVFQDSDHSGGVFLANSSFARGRGRNTRIQSELVIVLDLVENHRCGDHFQSFSRREIDVAESLRIFLANEFRAIISFSETKRERKKETRVSVVDK
jgi:hypothetical protein